MDASTLCGCIHGYIHAVWMHPWTLDASMDITAHCGYIRGCNHQLWMHPWIYLHSMDASMDSVDISMDASIVYIHSMWIHPFDLFGSSWLYPAVLYGCDHWLLINCSKSFNTSWHMLVSDVKAIGILVLPTRRTTLRLSTYPEASKL